MKPAPIAEGSTFAYAALRADLEHVTSKVDTDGSIDTGALWSRRSWGRDSAAG